MAGKPKNQARNIHEELIESTSRWARACSSFVREYVLKPEKRWYLLVRQTLQSRLGWICNY